MQTFQLRPAKDLRCRANRVRKTSYLATQWQQVLVLNLLTDGVVPVFFCRLPRNLELFECVLKTGAGADKIHSLHLQYSPLFTPVRKTGHSLMLSLIARLSTGKASSRRLTPDTCV